MIGLVQVELAFVVVACLTFVTLYVWRSPWRDSPIGVHMAIFAVALAGAVAPLLAASFSVRLPLWVFVAGFGLLDVLLVQRIVLLLKAQEGPPMNQDTFWWRLVHLEPTVLRGLLTGLIGLAGALGILISPDLPDTILGVWVPLMALVQVLWTRPAVTANAKVVVEAPNPISDPTKVVAGEAVTKASTSDILDAARDVPRG